MTGGWPGRPEVYQELFGALGLPQEPPPRSGFHVMAFIRISAAAVADEGMVELVWSRSERRARRQLDTTAADHGRTIDPDSVIRHHALAHAYSDDGVQDIAHSVLGPNLYGVDQCLKPDYFTVVWLARCVGGRP